MQQQETGSFGLECQADSELRVIDLGLCTYKEAYNYQLDCLAGRTAGDTPNTLIFAEHSPVITIGRSGGSKNLRISPDEAAHLGIDIAYSDRGGNITYHDPGQVVIYPILHLDCTKGDLLHLIRLYEEVVIRLLINYGISSERIDSLTGVWVGHEKIAAIGVAVKRSVSFHGFALNVNTILENFSFIIPCGLSAMGVTSMHRLLGRKINQETVKSNLVKTFKEIFGFSGSK